MGKRVENWWLEWPGPGGQGRGWEELELELERDRERKTKRAKRKKQKREGKKKERGQYSRGGECSEWSATTQRGQSGKPGRSRIPFPPSRMLIRALQIRSSPADPADWLSFCYRRGPCTCRYRGYIGELRCHVQHLYCACLPSVSISPSERSGTPVTPDRLSRHDAEDCVDDVPYSVLAP